MQKTKEDTSYAHALNASNKKHSFIKTIQVLFDVTVKTNVVSV
ncbi:hypothetical protein ACFSCZ_12610 [Siminovitchia sediminis]|uniref:Uncharacterized protein n=1 Tax=Siminovitchia sediminis TaxID=1274353 RepID=A0ABW4KJL9_9BACI